MSDILKHLLVDVHCGHCGDFTVRADIIAESQRMLAEGCPGSRYECPPQAFAPLLDPAALASLEKAWAELEATSGERTRRMALDEPLHLAVDSAEPGDRGDGGGDTPRAQR